MGFLSESKPYTAVTSTIERLTSEEYDIEDVADIVELVEIIQIRSTGYVYPSNNTIGGSRSDSQTNRGRSCD
jgi:hypothetical protein